MYGWLTPVDPSHSVRPPQFAPSALAPLTRIDSSCNLQTWQAAGSLCGYLSIIAWVLKTSFCFLSKTSPKWSLPRVEMYLSCQMFQCPDPEYFIHPFNTRHMASLHKYLQSLSALSDFFIFVLKQARNGHYYHLVETYSSCKMLQSPLIHSIPGI